MSSFDVKLRLSVMNFLEYMIWGAWLPLMNNYLVDGLRYSPDNAAWVQAMFPIASLIFSLIGGQLADRFINGEKFIAVAHFIGGLAILAAGFVTDFYTLLVLFLVHCLCYTPTMGVCNAICFAHVKDPQKDFALLRLWGTIGWIAASIPMTLLLSGVQDKASLNVILIVAGIAELALAIFSFFLPPTPPKASSSTGVADSLIKALGYLGHPLIMALFIATFADTVVHNFYFFFTGRFLGRIGIPENYIMWAMSVGQIAEIGTMAGLGYVLKRLGWKTTMTLGILGHLARFLLFSYFSPGADGDGDGSAIPLVIAANLLHGVCYAFYFATVFIFVDEYFPKDIRNNAQSIFNLAITGLAPLAANFLCAAVEKRFSPVGADGKPAVQFQQVFLTAALLAAATAAFFVFSFHPKSKRASRLDTEHESHDLSPGPSH